MVSMVSVRVRTSQLEWTSSHRCTSSRWGLSHFGDELRTHHLSLPRVFLALFFIPNFSPPTSFPAYFITIAQESSRAWVARASKRCKTQGLRKVESSTLKERWEEKALKEHGEGEEKVRGVLHSKCKSEKRKVRSLPSLHYFFFSMVFSFLILLEKKTMIQWLSSFSFIFFVDVSIYLFLVFCYEQGDNNKLVNIT